MAPTLSEGRDATNTKPIRPQPDHAHEPLIHYVPLPRKPPRKLDLDKCQHCRNAKQKCEMDHLQQQPSCRRCIQRGLQCPGLTRARDKTLVLSNAIPVIDSQLSTNAESFLRLKQLKVKQCLACLALGLSCTSTDPGETPCQNCLYAGSSNILRSRLCMRATPFEDISIFLYYPPKAEVQRKDLDLNGISLEFDVTWTLPSIMGDIVEFLRPESTKLTSKVGMLCSPKFVELVQKHIPPQAASLFQSMLYGMSFSYANPKQATHTGGVSVPMLQLLGAQAGHQILRYFDRELNPQQLSTFSIEKRQILFLLVFGVILAVRYARRTSSSQELPTNDSPSEELWETMREHLCERLAHHLVLLGASVGVQLSKDEEERVLRLPAITWNRKGTHAWEVNEQHSSCASRVRKRRDLRERAYIVDERIQYFDERDEYTYRKDPYSYERDPCSYGRDSYSYGRDSYSYGRNPYSHDRDPYFDERDLYFHRRIPYRHEKMPFFRKKDQYSYRGNSSSYGRNAYSYERKQSHARNPYSYERDQYFDERNHCHEGNEYFLDRDLYSHEMKSFMGDK